MKTAKQVLSEITGYTVEELTERNTEPLLQPEDCLKAMYYFFTLVTEEVINESLVDFANVSEANELFSQSEKQHL